MRKIFAYIIFYLNILLPANNGEPYIDYKVNKSYSPIEISGNQIIIDGILNESVWDSLYVIKGLEQAEPILNGEPSENTDIKICYDDEFLYVGVFLYNDINKISYKKGSDDDFIGVFDSKSDYFIIELDPYHDHQTSYGFAVNSSGVIADYMIYDDGKSASITYGNGNYYQSKYDLWGTTGILSLERAYSVPSNFTTIINLHYFGEE